MQLYFLGTGAGMPSRRRNVSSIVLNLLDECACCWMFDCGEGTQHQILQAPLKLSKLRRVFVTHLHGDHIFGIPGLITSRSNQGAEEPLAVYGPPGIRKYVENCLEVSDSRLTYELQIIEFGEGMIYEDERFTVETARLEHRIDSYGFRITERDLPGSLNVEKLKALGIQPGPVYGKLKQGHSVELADGTVVSGSDVIGPNIPGRVVTILGDTKFSPAAIHLSRQADVVVHEATFAKDRSEQASEYYHSTAADAARVAMLAKAKTLVLTHISSRYQEEGEDKLLAEARELFPNTYLANDFWPFEIERKKSGIRKQS